MSDTVMGSEGPTLPPDPPHGPNLENRTTHVALTEEQEAELPIDSLPPSVMGAAATPKVESVSGSHEQSTKSDTSTGATHGRDRVPDNKTK